MELRISHDESAWYLLFDDGRLRLHCPDARRRPALLADARSRNPLGAGRHFRNELPLGSCPDCGALYWEPDLTDGRRVRVHHSPWCVLGGHADPTAGAGDAIEDGFEGLSTDDADDGVIAQGSRRDEDSEE